MIGKISRIPYDFWRIRRFRTRWSGVEGPGGSVKRRSGSGFSMVCFLISNGCLVVWLITQAPVWISPVIMVCCWSALGSLVKGGQKQYEAKKRSRLESGKRLTRKKFGNRDAANERVLFGFRRLGQWDFLKRKTDRKAQGAESETLVVHRHEHGRIPAIALSILVIFALIFPVVQGNTSVGVFVSLVTSFMAMAQSLDVAATGDAQGDGAGQTAVGRHET